MGSATVAEPLIPLDWTAVALLAVVPVVTIATSRALKLGLTGELALGTVRSTVQLAAVGLAIGWVFEQNTWYWVVALLAVMTVIAGATGSRRAGARLPGFGPALTLMLAVVTGGTLLYVSRGVIGVARWDPRYLVPLGGILLGNGMTAATLAVERYVEGLHRNAAAVEVRLALGDAPAGAVREWRNAAVRAALTPFLNTMMIVGIVQLPGVMVGNILGGTPPWQAALYQLLIILVLAWVALAVAVLATRSVTRRFLTDAWQLDRSALRRATAREGAGGYAFIGRSGWRRK